MEGNILVYFNQKKKSFFFFYQFRNTKPTLMHVPSNKADFHVIRPIARIPIAEIPGIYEIFRGFQGPF